MLCERIGEIFVLVRSFDFVPRSAWAQKSPNNNTGGNPYSFRCKIRNCALPRLPSSHARVYVPLPVLLSHDRVKPFIEMEGYNELVMLKGSHC